MIHARPCIWLLLLQTHDVKQAGIRVSSSGHADTLLGACRPADRIPDNTPDRLLLHIRTRRRVLDLILLCLFPSLQKIAAVAINLVHRFSDRAVQLPERLRGVGRCKGEGFHFGVGPVPARVLGVYDPAEDVAVRSNWTSAVSA